MQKEITQVLSDECLGSGSQLSLVSNGIAIRGVTTKAKTKVYKIVSAIINDLATNDFDTYGRARMDITEMSPDEVFGFYENLHHEEFKSKAVISVIPPDLESYFKNSNESVQDFVDQLQICITAEISEFSHNIKGFPFNLIIMRLKDRVLLSPTTYFATSILALRGIELDNLLHDRKAFPLVGVGYNPTVSDLFYCDVKDSAKILRLNLAVPPQWLLRDDLKVTPEVPPLIDKYLTHLFVNKDEKDAFMDYLYWLVRGRVEVVIVFLGPKGTGKTLLISNIVAGLVGHDSFESIAQASLESRFTSGIGIKRLVVFDELKVNDRDPEGNMNKLKALTNALIPQERKHKEAKTIENHTSFVITSNDVHNFPVDHTDRRFSIPEVTGQRLEHSLTDEEIEFLAHPETDEYQSMQKSLGEYLLNVHKPRFNKFHTIKGDHYYKVAFNSMSLWKQHIVEYVMDFCEKDKPIWLSKIMNSYGKRYGAMARPQTAIRFINEYVHRGEYPLGEVYNPDADEIADMVSNGEKRNSNEKRAFYPNSDFLKHYGTASATTSEIDDIIESRAEKLADDILGEDLL